MLHRIQVGALWTSDSLRYTGQSLQASPLHSGQKNLGLTLQQSLFIMSTPNENLYISLHRDLCRLNEFQVL
jgi:hypothetical protein